MATAQFYKRNNNGQTLGGITQVVPVTPPPVAPPSSLRYKQDGIYGYTPPVQPGGINKITGRPSTGVSSAPSGGMIGGNAYNSMVAQNAAAQRPAPSYSVSTPNAASQNYGAYMMATQQLPERLAALGIYGTGQAESSQLQLDSAYAQAIAAYRAQQGGSASGAQTSGGSNRVASGSSGGVGEWRTDPTTGYMSRFNRETGRMESRMPIGGGLDPMIGLPNGGLPVNPYNHKLEWQPGMGYFDTELKMYVNNPAYYDAYLASTAGSGMGGGPGDPDDPGKFVPTKDFSTFTGSGYNLTPGVVYRNGEVYYGGDGTTTGYGTGTSVGGLSKREKLMESGLNVSNLSNAQINALYDNVMAGLLEGAYQTVVEDDGRTHITNNPGKK